MNRRSHFAEPRPHSANGAPARKSFAIEQQRFANSAPARKSFATEQQSLAKQDASRKPFAVGLTLFALLAALCAAACSSSANPASADAGVPSAGSSATRAGSSATSAGSSGATNQGSSGSSAISGAGGASAGSAGTLSGAGIGGSAGSGPRAVCKPDCSGKTCGSDGCTGTCGGCAPSQLCTAQGSCAVPSDTNGITVDASSQRTAISSAIYGVALSNDESMQVASLNRWGGDATTSYNWQNDAYNSGADWYCANYTWSFKSAAVDPTLKSAADQFIHYDIANKVDTLMTVPITGWVASMPTPYSALQANPDCAAAYGGKGGDQWKCCAALGTTFNVQVDKGSSVMDTSFVSNWVQHIKSTFGSAADGGVKYYQLDNEPDNWQALRRDIYPALYPPGTTCQPFYATNASIGKSLDQDFKDRTIAYAKAVKGVDPSARVLFMSTENAWDLVSLPNVECGTPLGPYSVDNSMTQALLKVAADEEKKSGTRLLDCVDMHYPFPGKGLGDTRALWDPAFTQYDTPVIPPHIQGWINGTYPGTGTCVSEYNIPKDGGDGSEPDPSTVAQLADIFGMYGRLGYQVAAYWGSFVYKGTHLPIYNALSMYRNYDGRGGKFGSFSIGAASPNSAVNVYASSDSATNPGKVWVMLVNVSGADQNGLSVNMRNFAASGSAAVYRADASHAPSTSTPLTITNGSVNGISLPSNSLALLVMTK